MAKDATALMVTIKYQIQIALLVKLDVKNVYLQLSALHALTYLLPHQAHLACAYQGITYYHQIYALHVESIAQIVPLPIFAYPVSKQLLKS
jgi:hypothetical protein